MKTLGSAEGVFGEPAGVAGFAGLSKALSKSMIKERERAVVIATGNGLKDIQNALKAAGEPLRVRPDFSELEKTLVF
jgi:threonine synthase